LELLTSVGGYRNLRFELASNISKEGELSEKR
jgi:hypothetical protein